MIFIFPFFHFIPLIISVVCLKPKLRCVGLGKSAMECEGFELYKAAKNKEVSSTLTTVLQQKTCKGNTILHLAVNFENKVIAEKILESVRTLLYETNNKGDTPLHIAARFGYTEMVELLINYI